MCMIVIQMLKYVNTMLHYLAYKATSITDFKVFISIHPFK